MQKRSIFQNIKLWQLKVFSVFLSVLIFSLAISFLFASCKLPEPAFEEIVISGEINPDTGEPVGLENEFDVTVKKIFASIKYSGVKGNDAWTFKWINTDTGQTILDSKKQFSLENHESYFEGIISTNISITDASKILSPGTYKVEFYCNDGLKKTATFKITNPQMQILQVETASSIDVLGKPVAAVLQFRPGETVFICVKLDYLISGNSIKAVWKNEAKEILNEEEINIDETYYSQTYKWFSTTLEPGSKFVNPGNYEVEVFLNDDLFDTIAFEVLEKEPVTFNNGIKYSNEEFNFSIAIPDGWSYQEQKEKNLAAITLSPGEDIPATFKFSVTTALPIQPYDEFTKADADNFAQQHGWVFADSKSRDYNLQNKYPTREIMYLYQDEKGANYVFAYSITEFNDKAYICNIVVEDQSYGELVQSVYSGILNSLQIQ